mgnify:CR=1 FL=1
MNYIYALICPIKKVPRYIGKTKNPKSRYKQHIAGAKKKQTTLKEKWLHSLHEKGLQPILKILQTEASEAQARELESYHVNANIDTVYNMHDPRKGAKAIKDKDGKIKDGKR